MIQTKTKSKTMAAVQIGLAVFSIGTVAAIIALGIGDTAPVGTGTTAPVVANNPAPADNNTAPTVTDNTPIAPETAEPIGVNNTAPVGTNNTAPYIPGNTAPIPGGTEPVVCNENMGIYKCDGKCVDIYSNSDHCGKCGNTCDTGEKCDNGICPISGSIPGGAEPVVCNENMGIYQCDRKCVDIYTNNNHCGKCRNACSAGEKCNHGVCIDESCLPGFTRCNGACVNLQLSNNNCGSCGHACNAEQECSNGVCTAVNPVCQTGQTFCNGTCVNTLWDNMNCGTCNKVCASDQRCSFGTCIRACTDGKIYCNGKCVEAQSDNLHCGKCNNVCNSNQQCINGVCDSPSKVCEGNFDCDKDVDGTDMAIFKKDYLRGPGNNPCTNDNPCLGDLNCDNKVDLADLTILKQDYGRMSINNPCPECQGQRRCYTSCTDTDGGYQPNTFGVVRWTDRSGNAVFTKDVCIAGSNDKLMEAICDANGYANNSRTYICEKGCLNGACKK